MDTPNISFSFPPSSSTSKKRGTTSKETTTLISWDERSPLNVLSAAESNVNRPNQPIGKCSVEKNEIELTQLRDAADEPCNIMDEANKAENLPCVLHQENMMPGSHQTEATSKLTADMTDCGPGNSQSIEFDMDTGPLVEATDAVSPDIVSCLKELQYRKISDSTASQVTLAKYNPQTDETVLFAYYALSCDHHFAPKFEVVTKDADSKEPTGVRLVDPEVSVTAWKKHDHATWKQAKVQACRFALRVWRRKHGDWIVPQASKSSSSVRISKLLLGKCHMEDLFGLSPLTCMIEYIKRYEIGSGAHCKLVKRDGKFHCIFEIQGFLNYNSGRTYETVNEAIDATAYDILFALAATNREGMVILDEEKEEGAEEEEVEAEYGDDNDDDLTIICERPGQILPLPRWYGPRRKSYNWSCFFDNKGQESLKRKRDSDQESNASKRVRTNDGKSLTRGKSPEQDLDNSGPMIVPQRVSNSSTWPYNKN